MSYPHSAEAARSPASSAPPFIEYQRQWQAGQQPRIETFLSQWPEISIRELAAVVRVDLRQRRRAGEQIGASDYLARFPQLLEDAAQVVDLIYTEFLVREELGEGSHLSLLQQQFPRYADELTAQVEFHLALENGPLEKIARESNAAQSASDADTSPPHETLGSQSKPLTRLPSLGPDYEVLAEIGRGGMGVVYRARQVGLNRLVALKMVRGAEYASAELLIRFRAEAEAVARLHHPQIVQTYDYGEHDGLPYLAMELVEGGTLASQLDGTPWPARHAASLVETLARAAEFAHQRGVIHRDLKPANVLLQQSEVRGQKSGEDDCSTDLRPLTSDLFPKIADFGLAKALREQSNEQTQSGALLGTPSYMAPEQAAGQTRQIGPAADVYALGAILYELLTGRPPFRAETPIATLQQVLTSEPVSIKLLAPRVPRDLVTICSKCLRREPGERYMSAAELADDLARLLADQPIRARPASSVERAWRWCRRNPVPALLSGAVALLLLTVAGVSSLSSARLGAQLQKTAKAEDAERTAKLDAQIRQWDFYLAEIISSTASRKIGQRFHSLATVDKAAALLPEIGFTPDRVLQLRNCAIAALAHPDFRRVPAAKSWWISAKQSTYSSTADRCSLVTSNGELAVVRISDGLKLFSLAPSGTVGNSAISPDGRFVVLFQDGVKVWRIDQSAPAIVWQEPGWSYFSFAPDSRHAAVSGADGVMRLLDVELGIEVRQLGKGAARGDFRFHMPSRRIAVQGKTAIQIIALDSGDVLTELRLPNQTGIDRLFDWHPSGDYVLAGSFEDGLALWHVASATRVVVYMHLSQDMRVRFIGAGDLLCTYSVADGSLALWNTGKGHMLLGDKTYGNFALDRSPGSGKLFRMGDSELETWEITDPSEFSLLPHGLDPAVVDIRSLDISPDGRLLAISLAKGLKLLDLATGRHWLETGIQNSLVKFTENGDLIVSDPSRVTRWPRKTQPRKVQLQPSGDAESEIVISYGPPRQLAGESETSLFAIDTSGQTLAIVPQHTVCQVIHADKPENIVRIQTTQKIDRVGLSSDGRWVTLVSASVAGASAFDALTGKRVADLKVGAKARPLFSPDNRWLATSRYGGRVWRVGDWQLATELGATLNTNGSSGLAFSSDSRVLAVEQAGGFVRLTDPSTGKDWASLLEPDPNGYSAAFLAFSSDRSKLIAMAADDHAAPRIWDLAAIRRELALRGLDWSPEVLQPQANSHSIDASTPLVVTFDRGSFLK